MAVAWGALEVTVVNAGFVKINQNLVDQARRNSAVKNEDALILKGMFQ